MLPEVVLVPQQPHTQGAQQALPLDARDLSHVQLVEGRHGTRGVCPKLSHRCRNSQSERHVQGSCRRGRVPGIVSEVGRVMRRSCSGKGRRHLWEHTKEPKIGGWQDNVLWSYSRWGGDHFHHLYSCIATEQRISFLLILSETLFLVPQVELVSHALRAQRTLHPSPPVLDHVSGLCHAKFIKQYRRCYPGS